MKNRYIKFVSSFICCFGLIPICAQTYTPFPTANASWNTIRSGNLYTVCERYTTTIVGDSLINGLVYHKLSDMVVTATPDLGCDPGVPGFPLTGCDHCSGHGAGIGPIFQRYRGAIREDLTQRIVYFVEPDSLNETVLYDFSLQVGDTVMGYLTNIYPVVAVIQSITTIDIGGNERKVFEYIWDSHSNYYIEGIGLTIGLLENHGHFEQGSELICFSENNESIYPVYNAVQACADIYKAEISTDVILETSIVLFPNPTDKIISIQLQDNVFVEQVAIVNSLGELVKTVNPNMILDNTLEVDITSLTEGMYLIRFEHESGVVYKSFVKK
jgi:hypothetical protein